MAKVNIGDLVTWWEIAWADKPMSLVCLNQSPMPGHAKAQSKVEMIEDIRYTRNAMANIKVKDPNHPMFSAQPLECIGLVKSTEHEPMTYPNGRETQTVTLISFTHARENYKVNIEFLNKAQDEVEEDSE